MLAMFEISNVNKLGLGLPLMSFPNRIKSVVFTKTAMVIMLVMTRGSLETNGCVYQYGQNEHHWQ